MYTTITSKYQVHIPTAIRKKAGINSHGRAKIRTSGSRIIIEPVSDEDDFMSLAGRFKVKNPIPAEVIRDFVEYAEDGRY